MDMPPAPAPGQAADALEVQRAVGAGIKRAVHFGWQSEESKRQRGEDLIRILDIAGTAAQHSPQNMLQQILQQQQQILQQQQETRAQLDNLRRRAFNSRAYDSRKDDAPLRALRKEADREAGGAAAAAAAGSLPEEGVFPATYGAALALTLAQLDALEAFYEEDFEGATVAERRAAFREFILT